jgi:D-alanyl-lipoteichoic acid acyltransferase DltB (MBOAT superfamily)
VCDAYVRRYVPAARPGTFILYGTFFPYLTAGPVERLNHMEAQLDRPAGPTVDDLRAGAALIALGLVKKLVVANRLQPYIDAVFSGEQTHSAPTVAFAVALNAVHLYADFSGYTDIARGAARCLGIDVRINFDRPFSSRSVTEFWRRWHISFSSWLRDYLYMPLAYSLGRVSPAGPVAAILITFLACGFWHRAAWTFVLFGALHGVALAAELRFGRAIARAAARWPEHLVALASRGYTLVFVALTIVLIPAVSVAEAGAIVSRIVSSPVLPVPREAFGYLGPFLFLLMLAAIALWQALERWQERLSLRTLPWFLLTAALAVLFLGSTGPGFVYEQF